MVIQSVTSNRKVVDLLNKLGHCASHSTIEKLETELTFEAKKEKIFIPNG